MHLRTWIVTLCLSVPWASAFAQAPDPQASAEGASAEGASEGSAEGASEGEADADYDPQSLRREGIDADAQARASHDVAQALYNAGRYEEAAAEWTRAYDLSGRPALLFNAYLAYREAGNLEAATRVLGDYLETDPADEERLRFRYVALREQLEAAEARRAQEQAERERLEAAREEEAERARVASENARAARNRALEAETRVHPAGFVVAGMGAAILLGGALAGGLALMSVADLEKECIVTADPEGLSCPTRNNWNELDDRRRRRAITADTMIALGAVTAVTGFILLFTLRKLDDLEEEDSATSFNFGCTTTGCQGGIVGSF